MPDNDGILNNDLYVSQISINSNVLKIKDTDARDDINDITLAIVANNEAIGSRINDLNTRLSGVQTTLTTEYAISTETGLALGLQSGDTYDEAFGKLEKSISDNERVTAAALNDLNSRVDEIPIVVKPDWNAISGSAAEILNKPDLSHFITLETQPNWNETNTSSAAYIQNKPTIPDAQIQSDWNQTTTTAKDYIKNKPNLTMGTNGSLSIKPYSVAVGDITLETSYDGGDININSGDHLKLYADDGNITISTGSGSINLNSTTYYNNQEIAVKTDIPTVPTTSTTVTQNDTNPVSGGAVYAKFEDLIGAAPAALDTLQEIATALNNDADLAGTLTTQISGKVPKVSNPTADNFASFNSDGTIKDSGHSHSDYITSIKTVNNESLVGTGNIVVSGLPAVTSADNGKILMVVNGQWQLVSPSVLYSGSGIPNNANGNNGDLYMQTN